MTVAGHLRCFFRYLAHGLVLAFTIALVSVVVLERVVPLSGRTTLVVAGPSMMPALQVGSAIVVEPVDPATLAVGDVVSIRSGPGKAIFTHRIVRLVQREGSLWLETKGDANPAADASILPVSAVLGRIVMTIPYGGYLVALASSPSGLLLIVALGLLSLTVGSILDPKRPANLLAGLARA